MPHFICAISTDRSGSVAAYALVEQAPSPATQARPEPGAGERARPTYHVRRLARFDGGDPVLAIKNLLADDEQYAGRVTLVVMGGQKVADRFHDGGLSAVPVEVGPSPSRDGDTIPVAAQTVVDTFAAVYRRSTVELPGSLDHASEALAALYTAMSEDAGAEDGSPEMEDLAEEETTGTEAGSVSDDGPKPAVPELSGGAASMSAARVGGDERREDTDPMATGTAAAERRGLEQHRAGNATAEVDLGEHGDVALALALACWYGERTADPLPVTDQADEIGRVERVRTKRRMAAQAKQGQRR